jgi:hypothetical protein
MRLNTLQSVEPQSLQVKPEAMFTDGDARRQATKPYSRGDFWMTLHGVYQA